MDRKEKLIREYLNKANHIIVSMSGGKDSLATLSYILEKFPEYKEKMILRHFGTHNDWPGVGEYLVFISERVEIPLKRIEPQETQEQMFKKMLRYVKLIHFPTVVRYCECVLKGTKNYKPTYQTENDVYVEGSRWTESSNRSKIPLIQKRENGTSIRPIIDFTLSDVKRYIKRLGIPLFYTYTFYDRLSCLFCPLAFLSLHKFFKMLLISKNFWTWQWDWLYALEKRLRQEIKENPRCPKRDKKILRNIEQFLLCKRVIKIPYIEGYYYPEEIKAWT